MLTLIENGEVFAPQPLGFVSLLVVGKTIVKVGNVDRDSLRACDLDLTIIDAGDQIVIPGLIDPHLHLLGGSGERGFASQTPEIFLSELIRAGVTTAVGCLGVDTVTKTMAALVGRAKALTEEGLSVFAYSGGYNVPPSTLTGSVRNDILFISEIIGAGEVAISDLRATGPDIRELARLVSEAYAGGLLSGKAGVTSLARSPGFAPSLEWGGATGEDRTGPRICGLPGDAIRWSLPA